MAQLWRSCGFRRPLARRKRNNVRRRMQGTHLSMVARNHSGEFSMQGAGHDDRSAPHDRRIDRGKGCPTTVSTERMFGLCSPMTMRNPLTKRITCITESNYRRSERENGNFISHMDTAQWPGNRGVEPEEYPPAIPKAKIGAGLV